MCRFIAAFAEGIFFYCTCLVCTALTYIYILQPHVHLWVILFSVKRRNNVYKDYRCAIEINYYRFLQFSGHPVNEGTCLQIRIIYTLSRHRRVRVCNISIPREDRTPLATWGMEEMESALFQGRKTRPLNARYAMFSTPDDFQSSSPAFPRSLATPLHLQIQLEAAVLSGLAFLNSAACTP